MHNEVRSHFISHNYRIPGIYCSSNALARRTNWRNRDANGDTQNGALRLLCEGDETGPDGLQLGERLGEEVEPQRAVHLILVPGYRVGL